jgi:hypothetical protein
MFDLFAGQCGTGAIGTRRFTGIKESKNFRAEMPPADAPITTISNRLNLVSGSKADCTEAIMSGIGHYY